MASQTKDESAWSRSMSLREQMSVTKEIFSFALPLWKNFLLAIVFSITSVALSVIMPRVIQSFIDDHLVTLDVTLRVSIIFALTYFFLLLGQGLSHYLSTYLFKMAAEETVETIRNVLFTKINTLGMRYFDQTPSGSIVSRITNDTESLKEFWNTFYSLFEGIVTVVTVFIGMYILNPGMAMMFLIFVPIMLVIIWFYQTYSSKVYRTMRENLSRLNTKINENILGMSIIQHFRQEKRMIREFENQNDQHYKSRYEMVKMNALLLMSIISLLEGLSLALVIYVLGGQYLDGILEVGVVYAFVQYSAQFFRPMGMMMDSLSFMQDGVVSGSRILTILNHKEAVPQQEVNPQAKITEAKIEFKDVSFSYDGQQKVLNNISFTVNPGETVAIVGHTGSGKSSIINVLMRFYEFQQGEVLIDGYSIKDFDYPTLREEVGLVLQDSFLFYGDVNRNIRLLNQSISDQTIQDAAAFVNADSFINKYSDGFNHKVIERGASYSSGEKQLISFARTMARQPKILILDEATANIDTETEEYIQASLAKMRENRTTIAIAHRLSTIRDANQIIVLDKGEIIEQGTHDELIALGGTYYQMYRLQSKE